MASFAVLSSHRGPGTRCGHLALPIMLIGASFMVVACQSVRDALREVATIGQWPVDGLRRIARGHHRGGSCRHSQSLQDHPAVSCPAQALTATPNQTTISKTTPCWPALCDPGVWIKL